MGCAPKPCKPCSRYDGSRPSHAAGVTRARSEASGGWGRRLLIRKVDRQTGRQADRQTDRQTDRYHREGGREWYPVEAVVLQGLGQHLRSRQHLVDGERRKGSRTTIPILRSLLLRTYVLTRMSLAHSPLPHPSLAPCPSVSLSLYLTLCPSHSHAHEPRTHARARTRTHVHARAPRARLRRPSPSRSSGPGCSRRPARTCRPMSTWRK